MKHGILTLILVATTTISFSQDYMDDVALKACECLSTVSGTLESAQFNMELGVCMLEAATPYQKKFKKDHDIDFTRIDTQGEKLGRILALRMVSICPDNLMKMANKVNEGNEVENLKSNIFEGMVTNIEVNNFMVFSVKNELGKISKFYWLTFIESNLELSNNYETLQDKSIRISFITQEFFDPRIGEYSVFNVMEKLEVLDK